MEDQQINTQQGFPLWRWYVNSSLQIRLLILLLPLVIGTLIVMIGVGSNIVNAEQDVVREELQEEAIDLQEMMSDSFETLPANIDYLKTQTAATNYAQIYLQGNTVENRETQLAGALSQLERDLRSMMAGDLLYSRISLLDLDGMELVQVHRQQGVLVSDSTLVDDHLSTGFIEGSKLTNDGQLWVSNVYGETDELGDLHPTMQLVTPLVEPLNTNGVVGYFVIDLNLESVFRDLDTQDINDGFAFIVDSDGYYIGHSLRSERAILFGRETERGEQLSGDLAGDVLSGSVQNIELSLNSTKYQGATAIISPFAGLDGVVNPPVWTVVVADPEGNGVASSIVLMAILAGVFIVLIAATGSFIWTMAGRLTRQFELLRSGFQHVYAGELSTKLPEDGGSEFGEIAVAFNRMTDQVNMVVHDLETRVQSRIRDAEITAEISREVAGLRDLNLVLNRTINRIVERFDYYHSQVFLVDDVGEYAVLVASTKTAGRQLLALNHKLAVGSDSVIGRVTAFGTTVIATDTQSNEVPWSPNPILPDTRSEMAMPLKSETRIIGALDIQSVEPDAFSPNEIEIFQVLADQLGIAINNARLIEQLQSRVQEVNMLNQRLTEKVWSEFTQNDPQNEPFSYRYNMLDVESTSTEDNGNSKNEDGYSATIEVAGNQIGSIKAVLPRQRPLVNDDQAFVDAVAARVSLAIDNARLVQQTQLALSEVQRLYETARAVSSSAELGVQDIYELVTDQLIFQESLDHVSILLAEPIPSYLAGSLVVAHTWDRREDANGWVLDQQLNLLKQGLSTQFENAPRESLIVQNLTQLDDDMPAHEAITSILDTLGLSTVLIAPLMTGIKWFGMLVCGSKESDAFGENFINFTSAVGDQLAVAVDNRRLFGEVEAEARRALALAEAGQLASQIGGEFESGVDRLFRVVSGPGEFDRWWFGLLSPDGQTLRQVVHSTSENLSDLDVSFPETLDLRSDKNSLCSTVHLREVILVNEYATDSPDEMPQELQHLYGKHLAVPVMVAGDERIGALLIGRDITLRDFDERDIQLATTLASQLAVATENQRLFAQAEGQRLTLQSTIEAMPAGVVVMSASGDVILTNQQAEDILGPGIRKELFGKNTYPIYQLGSDELYPLEQFPITLATERQQTVSAENLYVKHPDGRRIDLLANAAPVVDEQSNIQTVVFVFQEITELRELELALQASLSETTALYEASRTVATVTSVDDLADALMGQIQNFAPDQFFVLVREGQDQGRFTTRIAGVWPPMDGDEAPQLPIPLNMLAINDTLLVEDTGRFSEKLEDLDPEFAKMISKAREENIQSFIIVPLKGRGNTILGWFTAIYHKGSRQYSPEERRFLSTLADQTAVVLDSIRSFESTQNALRFVANLYRGSTRISEAQGISEAVTVIKEELQNFKPDRIDLLIQQSPEDPDNLYAALGWTEDRSLTDIPCLPITPETLKPQVEFDLLSRDEYYIQDILDNDEQDNELRHGLRALDTPYRAILSVPLRVSGRTVGRLALGFLQPRFFMPDDKQFATMLADSTAYIVENELLFQQTQDSLEETGVLYQASRAIANAELREDVVQAIIDYAASAVVDKVMLITLLSEDWNNADSSIEVTATWGGAEFLDLKNLRFTSGQLPIWNYLASTDVIWSDDVENDDQFDDFASLGFRTLDVASFVVVPLQTPNRSIGAVLLAASEPRVHSDREIRIYQSLADQAAVQLENKRLFEQAAIRARQLETSAEVSRAATSILNLEELFPKIVDLIKDRFSYDHVQVFVIDSTGQNAVLAAATGEPGRRMLEVNHSLPVGSQSVVGQATGSGETFLVNDTSDSQAMHRPNPFLPSTRAELAIPLDVKGVIVGVLDVQSNQSGAFSNDDVQALRTLADQLAVAIDNARLFEVSQQRAAEMSFLFDITSSAAASTGSLLGTLETVCTILIKQLTSQEVSVFLYNRESKQLNAQVVVVEEVLSNGHSAYRILEPEIILGLGEGLIGWVAEQRKSLIVPDLHKDPRTVAAMTPTRSGIYVPMQVGSDLIGVLALESGHVNHYSEDNLRLLQSLSSALTAIVQNAQLLEEVQRTNERLLEIDHLKTNFLAAMSHELRTPLNSIIGFSRVILKGIDGPINDMQEQDIQTIHDSGKHLLGLVNDILDQAKIEAGKMELVREYFDLPAVIESVMSSIKGLTKDKPIRLYTEIEDGLPQAYGDEFRTRQIMFNLLSNAAKFTHEGGVTASAYVASSETDERPMITVSITDTGIGIAEEDLDNIFQSFQQVDNTTTREVEGTGLGLPLARSFVELQGGRMWVDSEPGIGSIFYVTIPMEPSITDTVEIESPIQDVDEEPSNGQVQTESVSDTLEVDKEKTLPKRPNIALAVDDEVGMINLYRRYLSKEGWHIIGVTNSEETEEMIAVHRPNLILLDINMPNRDGWQVLEALQEKGNAENIPIIVCSIENDVERSSKLGATKHLVKPFVETDLVNAVQAIQKA